MKKLLCLILFSLCICSCSKDDDEIYEQPVNNLSIVGTWKDKDYGEVFIFCENEVTIMTSYGEFYLDYTFTGKSIIFYERINIDYSKEIAGYQKQINDITARLKDSRGEARQHLLDEIASIRAKILELASYERHETITYYSDILKFNSNELSFYIDDAEYNLIRLNN